MTKSRETERSTIYTNPSYHTTDEMISLTKAQVPDYLVGGDFYNFLSADDEEEFSIPQECLKPTVSVSTASELKHILNTLRFWGVFKLPYEIIELIIFKSKPIPDAEHQLMCDVLREFDLEFKLYSLFKTLRACTNQQQRLKNAQISGREDVLEYMYLLEGKATVELIKGAAENGHLHLLERLTADYLLTRQRPFAKVSMATVASRGFSNCLRYLLQNGCNKGNKFVASTAAANGHLACMQVAHQYGCDVTWVTDSASSHGHLNCLAYAHTHFSEVDDDTACAAANGGQVECLQFILAQGVEPTADMCAAASLGGSLSCLQLLRARGAPLDVTCTRAAARNDHLSCLKFLLDQGCPTNFMVTCEAAKKGHHSCLNLLLKTGCEAKSNSIDGAAAGGHLDCMRVLELNNVAISDRKMGEASVAYIQNMLDAGKHIYECAISAAICSDNTAWAMQVVKNQICWVGACNTCYVYLSLRMLKILHKFKCPWFECTCAAAAANTVAGLDCLQYAHENGCPWDESTTTAAARAGQLQTLTYALENGCPCNADACLAAAEVGHLQALQLLHEHGCPWDARVSQAAAESGSTACLRFCVEHGCPMIKATMEAYNNCI